MGKKRGVSAARRGAGESAAHLRQDLALADDERVQARRHAQQVPRRVLVVEHEEILPEHGLRQARPLPEVRKHLADGVVARGRDEVQFKAVARGQYRRLAHSRARLENCRRRVVPLGLGHRQALAHVHRRRVVGEAYHEGMAGRRRHPCLLRLGRGRRSWRRLSCHRWCAACHHGRGGAGPRPRRPARKRGEWHGEEQRERGSHFSVHLILTN